MAAQQGVTSQQIFKMLMESQYWPPEQMLAYQRTQLEQLLRHAKANVPFYETRLDCVFRKDGSIDWNRWEEIPIVTRADLRDRREDMQARILPPGHGPTRSFFSSGSTGVPIKYNTTYIAQLMYEAAWRRYHFNLGFSTPLRYARILGRTDGDNVMQTPFEWSNREGGQVLFISRELSPQEQLDIVEEQAIDILTHKPLLFTLLAEQNLARRRPIQLKGALTWGGTVSKREKQLVETSFKCKFGVPYSSKEGGLIAALCSHCGHYHVTSESIFHEFVQERPTEASPECQTMLITPLFTTAQPLIRYRQGDSITLATDQSPCPRGITLPKFADITGRADPLFKFGDKLAISFNIYEEKVADLLGTLAVQIAQVSSLGLEVRYAAPQAASSSAKEWITAHLCKFYHADLNVRYIRVADLPSSAGGKSNRYVCEYNP